MRRLFASTAFLLCLPLTAQDVSPPDLLRQAAAAYQAGDLPTAIRLYRAFLKDFPDAAEIRSNLGAALVGSSQLEEAITEYKTALKAMPNNPRLRTNLALAYYKLGRLPEAIGQLDVVRSIEPLGIKPALLQADCLLQSGQPQKALDLLTPILNEFPDDRALLYAAGTALLKLNQPEQAQALMDRVLKGGQSAESEYLLGQNEYLRNNLIPATQHLARAVELNPNLPGLHSLYGQVLRTAGNLDASIAQFAEELKINPFDFTANAEIAMLRRQEGKLDESLLHLSRALQVRPTDPGALLQRASIFSAKGQIDQARQQLESLVKSYPDFSEAHAALATVYYKLKRPADGDRERALARKGKPATAKPAQ